MFTFIDLFAGIGGIRLALEAVGGMCVFSSEWDKFAQQTYEANYGEKPQGDITQIPTQAIPDFDLLAAGFPCQPFSSIGKREGFKHLTQGTLFYDVVRILADKRPPIFLLENVEGLINHDKGRTLKTIVQSLAISENGAPLLGPHEKSLGYHLYWDVLDAKDYGLPQKRRRIFLVGFDAERYSKPQFSFPKAHKTLVPIGPSIQQNVKGYSISKHLQKTYLFKKDDGRPQIVTPASQIQVKTLVSTYHKIQRLTGTFVHDKGSETGLRLLSQDECKAIMGFPSTFHIPVSRTQMYRQMGNSVAVDVVKAIACMLRPYLIPRENTIFSRLNK